MDREDYPYCIYCNAKITWVSLNNAMQLLVFHCGLCGNSVSVEIELENGEGLLQNPRSVKGCR